MAVPHTFAPRTRIRSGETNANNTSITNGSALNNITNNIIFANNIGVRFMRVAGVVDSQIYETVTDDLAIRIGSTNKGLRLVDNLGNLIFRVETAAADPYVGLWGGTDLRIYGPLSVNYLRAYHDNTDGFITTNSGDLYFVPNGNDAIFDNSNVNIRDGRFLRIYNPGDTAFSYLQVDANDDLFFIPAANDDVVVIGRMPRRSISSNTYVNSHIQSGWGYIQGNGTSTLTATVTLTKACSSDNYRVVISAAGIKVTNPPTDEADVTTPSTFIIAGLGIISSSQVGIVLDTTVGTFSVNNYYLYHWIAIGPA